MNSSIWPIDGTQTSINNPGWSGPGNNGNKEVFHSSPISRTETLPSDAVSSQTQNTNCWKILFFFIPYCLFLYLRLSVVATNIVKSDFLFSFFFFFYLSTASLWTWPHEIEKNVTIFFVLLVISLDQNPKEKKRHFKRQFYFLKTEWFSPGRQNGSDFNII